MSVEQSSTPSGYVFNAIRCETAGELEEALNKWRSVAGFYPYFLPQNEGVILVVATENPEARKFREAKTVVAGLEPLTEKEATEQIRSCAYLVTEMEREGVDLFLTWLYEHGFEVCRKTDKEVKP